MEETPAKPRPNTSLQKRTAARIAAIQCIYTRSFHDIKLVPAKQVEILKERLHNNKQEQELVVGMRLEPNYKFVESLLDGVESEIDEINHRIDSVLSVQWKRERMSQVLVAILQCAVYELFFGALTKPKIIIDEYVKITRGFFSDAEVDFVYGMLNSLVQRYE